ncbi:MAG TPA: hypothetical protein VG820_07705 [Fimbriimonadaceae bacterium]|nr:hypothetical protein [Fimbriimonadaceae bacterium]
MSRSDLFLKQVPSAFAQGAASSKFFGILGLIILAFLISISGVLACCVGLLFSFPFLVVGKAVLFHDFFRPKAEPSPPSANLRDGASGDLMNQR